MLYKSHLHNCDQSSHIDALPVKVRQDARTQLDLPPPLKGFVRQNFLILIHVSTCHIYKDSRCDR